ncbi:hypothetical protein HK100_011731 [Physocladia obscura]|uniref:Uncharacterized protein n=1 Tax=Physocladia obscura TaxID=109957 RepID=A0AAD5T0S9_9FUNG|nr:hypothetical protein HK100_011731 [Physocladia obscura]
MSWITEGRTVIITGGASGIGLAFTCRLTQDGNKVVIIGRRQDVIDTVVADLSSKGFKVHGLRGDVTTAAERVALFNQIKTQYPDASVLINNAGIQRTLNLTYGDAWENVTTELDINLHAPIHLSMLFSKHWIENKTAGVIATVTSGLSFIPASSVPVYCATKAGLHSFTWSLRHQLKYRGIKVVEIIPPAVSTNLNAPGVHTFGVNVDVFTDEVYGRLKQGEEEVGYGTAEKRRLDYRAGIRPMLVQQAMSWLTQERTVIITGGASGIGLAFTRRLTQDGNKVVIIGRRQDVIDTVVADLSSKGFKVHGLRGDVTTAAERVALFNQIKTQYPDASVLINNAGIQRTLDLTSGEAWENVTTEVDINLHAPIHLSMLFAKHWIENKIAGVIATITSGLSFIPLTPVPVYCATKAGLHSFTWSLRHQLKNKDIKVIEIIPPAVNTDLNAPGKHTFGVNVDVFADEVYGRLKQGEEEVGYGMAEQGRLSYRNGALQAFENMNM